MFSRSLRNTSPLCSFFDHLVAVLLLLVGSFPPQRSRVGGCVSSELLALWFLRTMPSAATLLVVALLCTQGQDVVGVSSATSGNRSTKGRTQLVSVSAPWPTSPLSPLAEASEFVAEGGGSLFWDFVEALGDAPHSVFCPPPSRCSGSAYSSAGNAAATAEEGGSRHGSPREPAATPVTDASQPQQQRFVPSAGDEDAARLAADAAVTAAGHGFGSGATASGGGGGGGTPGVGLGALSLRLLEVALSARCVSCLVSRS